MKTLQGTLSLHFFLVCHPEDDEKQQKLTLKKAPPGVPGVPGVPGG